MEWLRTWMTRNWMMLKGARGGWEVQRKPAWRPRRAASRLCSVSCEQEPRWLQLWTWKRQPEWVRTACCCGIVRNSNEWSSKGNFLDSSAFRKCKCLAISYKRWGLHGNIHHLLIWNENIKYILNMMTKLSLPWYKTFTVYPIRLSEKRRWDSTGLWRV